MSDIEKFETSEAQGAKPGVFDEVEPEVRVRTKKMLMYFIIFAIVMLFGGFTSAIIILGSEYWVHIVAPQFFYASVGLVVVSSITMFLSLRSMKQGKKGPAMGLLALTFLLGLVFSWSQWVGWQELESKGMGFTVSQTELGEKTQWNSVEDITGEYDKDWWVMKGSQRVIKDGDDFYLPSDTNREDPVTGDIRSLVNNPAALVAGLVTIHVLHLLLGLIYMIVNMIRINKGRIHQGDTVQLQVNGIYWHFMGLLWIYLFLFLFFIH